MSNITINPKDLELAARSFNTEFTKQVSNVIKNSTQFVEMIALDWKGSSAGVYIPISVTAVYGINYVGKVATNIAQNIANAAKHAADRDENAAGGQGVSWGVNAVIEDFSVIEVPTPSIDTKSALNITTEAVTLSGKLGVEFSKLSPMLDSMKDEYEKIILKAGWESGYDNIKSALSNNISSAKGKVAELETDIKKVISKIDEAQAFIMKDATVDGASSGPGPIAMEQ